MWLTTVLTLCVAQADARVIREGERVCIEAPDANGALQTHCRPAAEAWSPPRAVVPPAPAPLHGVGSVNLGFGVLTSDRLTLPELAFLVDLGVLFANGVGIVGLAHAHLSLLLVPPDVTFLQRYGLGAALRLGARSHLLIGVTGTLKLVQDTSLRAAPSLSVVIKGALVVSDSFTLLLMPVFSFDQSVTFSVSAGIGASL